MLLLISLLFFFCSWSHAEELDFEGFIDVYYADEFNDLPVRDRLYTTQPARDEEFNINLAYFGFSHKQEKVVSHLTLQAGTSVQANYSTEPEVGEISGDDLSRHILEGYVKYLYNEKTSLVGGIFASHIGNESFISFNNWTYTRSLASDFSPFYQAGVGGVYEVSPYLFTELYILNGWQNISEDDNNKALGAAVRYVREDYHLAYTNFLGKYEGSFRSFHDIHGEWTINESFAARFLFDYAWQKVPFSEEMKNFYTYNVQLRYALSPAKYLTFRFEQYNDPYELNVEVINGRGFEVTGYSVNYDILLTKNSLWRLEGRRLMAEDDIFIDGDSYTNSSDFIVTSIATKF